MASVNDLVLLSEAVYELGLTPGTSRHGWTVEEAFPAGAVSGRNAAAPRGFAAALFSRSGEHALAIRGTEPSDLLDWSADVQIAWGTLALAVSWLWPPGEIGTITGVPWQYREALLAVMRIVRGRGVTRFYATGHSLGGGLAMLVGAAARQPVVTFNTAGIAFLRTHIGRRFDWDREQHHRRLHVRARHDPVSSLTPDNPGRQRFVNVKCRVPDTGSADQDPSAWMDPLAASAAPAVALGRMIRSTAGYLLCQHGIAELRQAVGEEPSFREDLRWLPGQ